MAAKSNNKYDVFKWIMDTISSCKTYQHLFTTLQLIKNFEKAYPEEVDLYRILRNRSIEWEKK
jgi:hypothetical protein